MQRRRSCWNDLPASIAPSSRSREEEGSRYSLPAGGFLENRVRFYSYPLPFSTGDLESWLRWAREHSPAHVREIQSLLDGSARMAVPLRAKGEILGVLLLGPKSDGAQYSSAEKQLLRQCGEQLTLMIENARLTTRVVEQEKLRRDVALAAEVQKRLLPGQPPEFAGGVLAALSLPARSVGGDYYDFLDLGDRRIGIALADIAGKGVAAALIMAVVQASLRIVAAEEGTSLPELAAKMNGFLHRSTGSNSYATFFYAQLDEAHAPASIRERRTQSAVPAAPRDGRRAGVTARDPRALDRRNRSRPLPADDI